MDGYSSDDEGWMPVEPAADGYRWCEEDGCRRRMCHGHFVYTHCCKGCLNFRFCGFDCDVAYIRARIRNKCARLGRTRLSLVKIQGGRDLLLLYGEREKRRRVGPIFRQWVQSVGTSRIQDVRERHWHKLLGDRDRERMVLVDMCMRSWVMMWKINLVRYSKWQCLLAKAELRIVELQVSSS